MSGYQEVVNPSCMTGFQRRNKTKGLNGLMYLTLTECLLDISRMGIQYYLEKMLSFNYALLDLTLHRCHILCR